MTFLSKTTFFVKSFHFLHPTPIHLSITCFKRMTSSFSYPVTRRDESVVDHLHGHPVAVIQFGFGLYFHDSLGSCRIHIAG